MHSRDYARPIIPKRKEIPFLTNVIESATGSENAITALIMVVRSAVDTDVRSSVIITPFLNVMNVEILFCLQSAMLQQRQL